MIPSTTIARIRRLTPWGFLLGVGVGFAICAALTVHSCRSDGKAEGRIYLAEPAPRWEAPPRVAITLPDSPRAQGTDPGPAVEVETLVPKDAEVDREIRDRFALEPEEPILALKDFPRFRWGGDLAVTVKDGRAEITERAFDRPWREWDPRWSVGAGGEVTPEGPGWVGEVRYNPARVWSFYPEVSGGWSESRGWYSRGMVFVSW